MPETYSIPYRLPDDDAHYAADAEWMDDLRTGKVYYLRGITVSTQESGLGIAALAASLLSAVLILGSILAIAIIAGPNPRPPDHSPELIGFACSFLAGIALSVLAAILGLVGLFQPDRRKTCALIGLILSSLELFGIIGLTLIGLAVG